MSTKASILFMIVFVLLFVSCAAPEAQAPAAEPPPLDKEPAKAPPDEALSDSAEPDQEDMLNPGDMIGEMEITMAEAWDWENNLFSLCVEGDAENEARWEENRNVDEYPCDLYAGTQLIFNCIGVDEEPDDSMDEQWSKLESEMILDGRPINLPAFGPLDLSFGDRALRLWNVLLKNMSSGDHTLVCRAEFDGVDYGETYYFTVSEPPKIEAPPDAKEMLFHGDSELLRTLDDFYVRLETALETNDLPHYVENHGGHAYSSWRTTTDDALVYFFGIE